jgi:tRNA(adenine34) deaminase
VSAVKIDKDFIEELMARAIRQGEFARSEGEVPVGAVLAHEGRIIAEAHNRTEQEKDATAHAEMLVMREAAKKLGNWRLSEAILAVTLEPCSMCTGALKLARIPVVIFGAYDPKAGAMGSLYDLSQDCRTGEAPRVISAIQTDECLALLKQFFKERRDER